MDLTERLLGIVVLLPLFIAISPGPVSANSVIGFPLPPFECSALTCPITVGGVPVRHLESEEVLVEGYVLDQRTGQGIQGVAVYPAGVNFDNFPGSGENHPLLPEIITSTDSNGFFGFIVNRRDFDIVVAACVFTDRRGRQSVSHTTSALPRAFVPAVTRRLEVQLPKKRPAHCDLFIVGVRR